MIIRFSTQSIIEKLQPKRLLRGCCLDPGFCAQLDPMSVNEFTCRINLEADLKPGPVGEYTDVIDVDPASNCFYEFTTR